ncbi:hypothetical protein AM593_06244, partial [Mytilus galloprovincialis]
MCRLKQDVGILRCRIRQVTLYCGILRCRIRQVTLYCGILRCRIRQISKCEHLKSVNFYDVRLSEINLSGCENLALIGVDSPVLKSIDISDCKSLTADQFLIGITIKSCVDYINMSGCNKMNSAEIDTIIQEFPSLNSFVFGGDHLTNTEINSVDLTTICFKRL